MDFWGTRMHRFRVIFRQTYSKINYFIKDIMQLKTNEMLVASIWLQHFKNHSQNMWILQASRDDYMFVYFRTTRAYILKKVFKLL